ncbi:fused D-ribose transporter subunits of ABC superfamily: ATP-binding components [Mesorhizobium metallidurans STM 2683]|uniref:Fused D-ribose transporter subunits of ABC superfamily: ATP-binding components n=1 Tax=Mesorhizobium metallidurans STM 2683 TaxID=1297569 RepID=M5EH91_9HYPH|nr:sugar ABC transporter ATP-binding protein [Mesorhizobium metallidurans]CCV03732.1 fused D-ribose transporter subunits of ABC superfamily: ATP-binding components [Mesorhizobium metallidurans STM 2683]
MELLLEVEGLKKSFGGVAALRDGRFQLRAGTVHALCGGNGAGKSTFLKILMGIFGRDAGSIRRRGKEVEFASPADALASGIAIIEQELSPVPHMTVAENIYLGREPKARFGGIDFRAMNRSAQKLLDDLEFDIRATQYMMNLSVAQMQLVEIAKALSHNAEVIFMDEPTSAIGEREAQHLFAAIRRLQAQGRGIVYVSHRLSEIFQIADSYTVFRDGAYVGSGALADIDRPGLIRMIVGRELSEEFAKTNTPTSEPGIEVAALSCPNKIEDISFSVRKGEIFGIYGLMGAGRTEIFNCLFGLDRPSAGSIRVDGTEVSIAKPADAMAHGLALVTEDRKLTGLNLADSVRANICMASLPEMSPAFTMDRAREADASRGMREKFQIKAARDTMPVSGLSGGNQQKVVLGKWFLRNPKVLLLDEPTRGVDVGAKREIYRIISDFASSGGTVVMISSEIDEVLGMSDRIMVMRAGRSAGTFRREETDAQSLVHLST